MAQIIKNKSELPAWFSLEKFGAAVTLDAAGWYLQLYIRARCLSYLANGEDISGILGLIRDAPLIDVTTNSELNFHYRSGMFYEQPIIEQSKHGVHSLTIHELYMAAINMEEGKRNQAKEYFETILGGLLGSPSEQHLMNPKVIELLQEPVHQALGKPLHQALLGVNLLLPDRELVEQFKACLPALRKECDAELFKDKWHKPDFTEWARLGVLPYLDLLIWQTENKAEVPNRVLEEAIFPIGEGSEDRVRKTTAPKAQELISKKTLAILRAQAIREQGEQRPE